MKKRIIIAIVIIILLSSLSIINSLSKVEEYDPLQEINKCMEQDNSSYRINKGKVYCYITNSTTTSDTTTITTKEITKKTTKKKTTKNIKMNVKATQQEMLDYTYTEVIRMGWTKNEYEIVVKLVSHESSWKPNNVNKKSGACGLFQAKPCSKVFKDFPDYNTNYKSQVKWGLNYIKDRYGTPTKAWNFWKEHKWY